MNFQEKVLFERSMKDDYQIEKILLLNVPLSLNYVN